MDTSTATDASRLRALWDLWVMLFRLRDAPPFTAPDFESTAPMARWSEE